MIKNLFLALMLLTVALGSITPVSASPLAGPQIDPDGIHGR